MLIQEIHQILKSQPRTQTGNTLFIAIDGHGGSGKSTLATILATELNAQVIRTDDFASWDNPTNWWTLVIERVFEPIKQGQTHLSYPRSSWWPDHKPDPIENQPVTEITILEGVSSPRHEFRPYLGFGIFVHTPESLCIERSITRDLASNTDTRENLTLLWHKWLEEEGKYFDKDNPKDYADLVIDASEPFTDNLYVTEVK